MESGTWKQREWTSECKPNSRINLSRLMNAAGIRVSRGAGAELRYQNRHMFVCAEWVQFCTKPGGTAEVMHMSLLSLQLRGQELFLILPIPQKPFRHTS